MNGKNLYDSLRTFGLREDDYGHVVCLLDCWTGVILSAVVHPDPDGGERSLTLIVASNTIDAQSGNLLAGATPTTVGSSLDDWHELCERAIIGATLVSASYVSNAFEEIGFSLEAFLSSPAAAAMNDDEKFLHLDQRLSYAITRRTINRVAQAAMDMPDDLRQHAIQALDLSYAAADRAGTILSEVDGQ